VVSCRYRFFDTHKNFQLNQKSTFLPLKEVSTSLADNPFLLTAMGLYYVMAFAPLVQYLTVNVVTEKEKGLKEAMMIQSLSASAFYASWGVVYWMLISVCVIIVVALTWIGDMFPRSNMFLLFLLIESYAMSLLAFGFIIGAVVSKAKPAGFVAMLAAVVLALPNFLTSNASSGVRYLLCLASPTAVAQALTHMIVLESDDVGLT
jgi:ATP-binding cassette subfamily A (ABC1) protein 5